MTGMRENVTGAQIEVPGGFRDWPSDWQVFRKAHPSWPIRPLEDRPIYRLPERSLETLSHIYGNSPPLLDRAAVKAERAFIQLCDAHRVAGSWNDKWIRCELLHPSPPPTPDQMRNANWPPVYQRQILSGISKVQEAARRRKGVAGWLLTEPAFLAEVEAFATRWRQLPDNQRPSFPLERSIAVQQALEGSRPLTSNAAAFQVDLRVFLDRWGLMRMASWDLPDPQGPLLPNLLPMGSPALPAHGVHVVLPLHYPLQGDDRLLDDVLSFQRQAAQSLGIDPSVAGLPHHGAYGTIFDVIHLERVIRSRIVPGKPARRLVGRMVEAIATALHITVDAVIKNRKAIAASKKGNRSKVKWLRPRVR